MDATGPQTDIVQFSCQKNDGKPKRKTSDFTAPIGEKNGNAVLIGEFAKERFPISNVLATHQTGVAHPM